MSYIEFEKTKKEINNKIDDLKKLSISDGLDLNNEINLLENKIKKMELEFYSSLTPWDKLTIARLVERPTSLHYIERIFSGFIEFHGDRYFGDDKALIGGIAYFNDLPVTVIGQQKGMNTKDNIIRNFGMVNPEGYRKSLRLMKQAEKFNRPIICFIDTPGAFCGVGAEERGQGEAIGRNLLEMAEIKVPIISIIIGEGGSGGALALAASEKVFMLEHSVYSLLSPEGFASILWKDAAKAKEAANVMKITAQDLMQLKIIDGIIPEPLGGAHRDVDKTAANIKMVIEKELKYLAKLSSDEIINLRYEKIRKIGEYEDG
jgi:acetyl-CoA carboxylase carboxyl transferase subunit alpha